MSIVIMGDIVNSSKHNGKKLMSEFKKVIALSNTQNEQHLLSPLTITLGDEFQGIVRSLEGAIRIVFNIEKELLSLKTSFKVRYVVHEGKIDTPLNRERAYEMLGPGLTRARAILDEMKTQKKKYSVIIDNKILEKQLHLMLKVMQGIEDNWTPAQQKVVAQFLKYGDYRKVAEVLKKDTSTIWRRRKNLLIEEFNALKVLITHTINGKWMLSSN